MSEQRRGAALSIAIVVVAAALAGFASAYASRIAAKRFEAAGGTVVPGSWKTLRSGPVIGHSAVKDGGRSYLVALRRLGAESRSVAVLGPDGFLRSAKLLSSGGSPEYAARMEALLNRAAGKKAESLSSPLDASLLPLVESAIEAAQAQFAAEKDDGHARR